MAFQFKCSECNAHIEVDDEYKDKKVTCPYCRKPTLATEIPQSAGEAADDAAIASGGVEPQAGAAMLPQEPRRKSSLGWIALAVTIIGGVALILAIVSSVKVFGSVDWQAMTPEEQAQTYQRLMAEHPSLQILGLLGACAAPVAAIVLSIITILKKFTPRWPAIVSLVLIGLLFLAQCAGIIMKGMAATQAAGTGGP